MQRDRLLTLIISSLFSLLFLELGLRHFTPFPLSPVSPASNKISHEHLGYLMDTNLAEIDEYGFRNDALPSIDIVTLGDSHTYGFNVPSDYAWPKILGKELKKHVYNMGIGGYGILQYQYLLEKAIELRPQAILLGLYLPNDLNDVCRMVASNQYWASRAKGLNIDSSLCAEVQPRRSSTRASNLQRQSSIGEWLAANVAAVSIASSYYADFETRKLIEDGKIKDSLVLNEEKIKGIISFKRIEALSEYMDLKKPHIKMAYEVLERFLLQAKMDTELNKIGFGILFIPSRERVFYQYLKQMDYDLSEAYEKLVDDEDKVGTKLSLFLVNAGIPFVDARPDLERALLEHRTIFPIEDNGHPIESGYQIYAENADELYREVIGAVKKN